MERNRSLLLNVILAAVVGLACLCVLLWRTFAPATVLPELNVPVVTALSLAALVVERYLAPGARRAWVPLLLLGGVTLGLLPWCAGLVSAAQALELCLLGGAVFAVTAMLYTSMADRLSSGPVCRAAPVLSAFLLFLAGQCLTGLLL